jgi:hypothetical protein
MSDKTHKTKNKQAGYTHQHIKLMFYTQKPAHSKGVSRAHLRERVFPQNLKLRRC